MTRTSWTRLVVFGGACFGLAAMAASIIWFEGRTYVRAYENVLGTSMEVKVWATSQAAADRADAAVLAEIDREARILSGYDAKSEFSQWMQTRDVDVPVSPELFDVLQRFDLWRDRTHGALDAAAETVSRVWKAAATAGHVPGPAELAQATAKTQQTHWRLNAATHTAAHLTDAPLILNSFTKSYIVDRAANAGLKERGVYGIIVNIGGDLVTRGAWTETVSITDPQANADNARPLTQLSIRDRAVATSGGYRRGFDINGVHYSHIVDPRTGQPTGHVLSATVISNEAADAGALATAFCVLSPEESEQLAAAVPGAEFMLVLADGRRIESAGWRGLKLPPARHLTPEPIATLHAAEQAPNFEVTVTLEIAQQPMRAERPYVAVWIEDKDRYPVRTLAVWYRPAEARFLSDLKVWMRNDRLRNMAEGSEILGSVSSATRSPGKYTLTWDGKDNAGKAVKPGLYTVQIEVAREHGTYQIMRQDVDIAGAPKQVTLPGGIEVASAVIDFHRAGK